jgi:hypothetical protein
MNKQTRSFHGYLLRQAKSDGQKSSNNISSIEPFLGKGCRAFPMGITANDTLWNPKLSQADDAKSHSILDADLDNLWLLPEP